MKNQMNKKSKSNKMVILLVTLVVLLVVLIGGLFVFKVLKSGRKANSLRSENVQSETVPEQTTTKQLSDNQDEALSFAKNIIMIFPFSYNGLITHLVDTSGYTEDAAKYAADNCGADWDKNALDFIDLYKEDHSSQEIAKLMETAGFDSDQIERAMNNVPANNAGITNTLSNTSTGEANALRSANSYLSFTSFSYTGLIEQLEYEGYTNSEATYAADNCGADWNAQALKSATKYLNTMPFSYSGLIEQLEYEGYTNSEATYGADNCGADWNAQAVKSAAKYLSLMSFSKEGLIEQLEYEGFTHDQAVYGAAQNGY